VRSAESLLEVGFGHKYILGIYLMNSQIKKHGSQASKRTSLEDEELVFMIFPNKEERRVEAQSSLSKPELMTYMRIFLLSMRICDIDSVMIY